MGIRFAFSTIISVSTSSRCFPCSAKCSFTIIFILTVPFDDFLFSEVLSLCFLIASIIHSSFICFFRSRQTALESSASIPTILILMSEPYHQGVSLFCDNRSWLATISKSRPLVIAGTRSLSLGKVLACNTCWLAVSQTYLSALFSCQRTVGLSACENTLYKKWIFMVSLFPHHICTARRDL